MRRQHEVAQHLAARQHQIARRQTRLAVDRQPVAAGHAPHRDRGRAGVRRGRMARTRDRREHAGERPRPDLQPNGTLAEPADDVECGSPILVCCHLCR
ncbi:MAG: hypothetical protein U1E52_18545 [Geminicoccaceae bacterium]